MIKIAITGNMGSGKTTISRIFESTGIPVFYADAEAKELYSDPLIVKKVKSLFGDQVFDNQDVSFAKLAQIVFSDKISLKKLEAVIHPEVMIRFEEWTLQNLEEPIVVMENAILFEGGFDRYFDVIVLVTCPEDIRIQRIIQRDGTSEADVKKRMNFQWNEDQKVPFCQYVIVNDNHSSVIENVMKIIEELKGFS